MPSTKFPPSAHLNHLGRERGWDLFLNRLQLVAGDSRIIDVSASPETEDSSGKEDNPVNKKKYGGNFKLRTSVRP